MSKLFLGVSIVACILLLGGCPDERWERFSIVMDGQVVYIWIGSPRMVNDECTLRGGLLTPGLAYGGCHDPFNRVIITPRDHPEIAVHEACHALLGGGHVKCGLPKRVEG